MSVYADTSWACLRCGSDAHVPGGRLVDRDQDSASTRLRVGLATTPHGVV